MWKLNWLIVILLTCSSCSEKRVGETPQVSLEKPEDLIPEEKMVQVMVDVHLLESVIGFNVPRPRSNMPPGVSPQQFQNMPTEVLQKEVPYYDIFKKHSCTRDQYLRSYRWYSMDPSNFTAMYDEVINELTRRQAKEQGSPAPSPVDSIK